MNENTLTNIKLIENENIQEKTIEMRFERCSKTLFKDIKPTIINKINEIKTIEGVCFGHKILRRNFALNFFAPKSLKLKKFKKN